MLRRGGADEWEQIRRGERSTGLRRTSSFSTLPTSSSTSGSTTGTRSVSVWRVRLAAVRRCEAVADAISCSKDTPRDMLIRTTSWPTSSTSSRSRRLAQTLSSRSSFTTSTSSWSGTAPVELEVRSRLLSRTGGRGADAACVQESRFPSSLGSCRFKTTSRSDA